MSSASLPKASKESTLIPAAVSTTALPLQGDSSLTETQPASREPRFNHSLIGQAHLVSAQPSSLGTGRALTPNLLPLRRGWERNAELTPEACCAGRRGHCQGDSKQTGHSSVQLDMVQMCHWFPIMGKRKNHSINHDGKMGCFGENGAYLMVNTETNSSCLILRNETRAKIKCSQRLRWH